MRLVHSRLERSQKLLCRLMAGLVLIVHIRPPSSSRKIRYTGGNVNLDYLKIMQFSYKRWYTILTTTTHKSVVTMAEVQGQTAQASATCTHAELQRKLAQMSRDFSTLSNQMHEHSRVLQECWSKLVEEQKTCSIYESLYAAESADHARSSQALQRLTEDCSELHDEIRREANPDRSNSVTPGVTVSSSSGTDEIYQDSAMFMTLFGEDCPLDCDSDDFWSPETIDSL